MMPCSGGHSSNPDSRHPHFRPWQLRTRTRSPAPGREARLPSFSLARHEQNRRAASPPSPGTLAQAGGWLTFLVKAFPAELADEGLVAGVDARVGVQGRAPVEGLPALAALVGLLLPPGRGTQAQRQLQRGRIPSRPPRPA